MTQIYTRAPVPSLHEQPSVYFQQEQHMSRDSRHSSISSSQYFDRRPEGNAWRSSQPVSPMSSSQKSVYDVSTKKAGGMYQTRPETTQKPTREQLPSLSSLFATSSHPPIPTSSYSERSPVFSAGSPLDARAPATPVHPDRSYDASYFQRPSVGGQYSYNSKAEQAERLAIPPPRPSQHGARPGSPRYDSRYTPIEVSRSHVHAPLSAWSSHPQSNKPEYLSRDNSSFRPHQDIRQPAPLNRAEADSTTFYREGQHGTPATASYPATPVSNVAGDPLTTKDGLGPKIWTGTQFLPRFVRQAEVPGEGMCYFYDDGTHCKTVIDGEIVNAHWGVTKAGKPRKRLAIACITCREKKIKCDPDYPRCVQCEKFGRICKFQNAPRGGHGSPDTPPSDHEDELPTSSRPEQENFRVEKRENSDSLSPRQVRHATPESEMHPSKRRRTGYHDLTPVTSEASPRPSFQDPASPTSSWAEPVSPGGLDQAVLRREWHSNPVNTQPALVAELLSVFFRQVPETVSCMFPQRPFKAWFLSNADKSPEDLMLVYTILALGTIFSQNAEHKPLGAKFAAVSRLACENSRFSIQLVQSRVLLALYYFANNHAEESWDYCGAALRAASGLKLNLELEKTDDDYRQTFPYGLNSAGFAECRRRTFWSCYLMDRFNGSCTGHLSVIQPEDVFLRLPCDSNSFESQVDVQNPFFDVTTPSVQNFNWTIGPMAYLINVATIWGDVMASIYRTSQRSHHATSQSNFAPVYENATLRLRTWKDSLPACYTFSTENLARAANGGKLGTFITMHTVYHTTAMKLNRYVQQYILSQAQLAHHVAVAKQHAEDLLKIMDTLAICRASSASFGPIDTHTRFSSPFVGYGIISAVDILTAKTAAPAAIPSRLASLRGSQAILAELALFWHSSKNQQALVQQRVADLDDLARARGEAGGARAGVGGRGIDHHLASIFRETADGGFEMREAMEKTFSRDHDCIYAWSN
ncbi:uncharacterized protein L3040_002719 [Drepanopeziza brunnea f. sp. 'multigermtubi']|uniref:Fungal specific transcription factor domain-containing protein n=1 Tax=Marssonina brunnea f. sp. multigermtubi (strain MB_m1) TaxID=1072389 RepID=K1XLR2_MARBU|nr:fungal specific transcription factor domain-containing protein [Drepanopeziza brunnea f. sp. 'multigermtubi' MB_m1]EKD13424.1 fungal specific transcription factor domain-containing protein [Drepanopeziza brunnea f. sp. 'multigermtubi' MB_m1]KAJ5050850.1 hypothetical protein L3040_002719 [Drepanopeziza brunnea f. sp. 'multigermtubi']